VVSVFKTVLTPFELPGLELARLADLPTDALTEAKRVAEKLAALQAKDEEESESSKIALHRKALLRVTFCF
jgi:DNA mismatch repair protein MSH4